MSFHGDWQWVYVRSCDVAGMELIECCGQQMEVSYADFKSRIPGCLHTDVVSTLLVQFDAQNMISPSNTEEMEDESIISEGNIEDRVEEEITELKTDLCLVKSRKGVGGKCLTCNACVVRCHHLDVYYRHHNENDSHDNSSKSHHQHCYSSKRIPFHASPIVQDTYKRDLTNQFVFEVDVITLTPEADVCHQDLVITDEKRCTCLFVMNKILKANACGPSYKLKSYPQYVTLNSQVVEQSNSRLQRTKGSLTYMTQANFVKNQITNKPCIQQRIQFQYLIFNCMANLSYSWIFMFSGHYVYTFWTIVRFSQFCFS